MYKYSNLKFIRHWIIKSFFQVNKNQEEEIKDLRSELSELKVELHQLKEDIKVLESNRISRKSTQIHYSFKKEKSLFKNRLSN